MRLSDQVIGDFIGLPPPPSAQGSRFDRYVIVNINGLKDFVDAIGGIDVPVTEQMDYDDNWGHLHIHFKPGLRAHERRPTRWATAASATTPAAIRAAPSASSKSSTSPSQSSRAQKLNDLLHIGQLIGALNKNVKTNLSFDEEKSLAWAFKDANTADLGHAETIPYADTKETPYGGEVVIPDPVAKAKILADLFGAYGNVTPPPASALAAIKPATIHLVVQNGSGDGGLGRRRPRPGWRRPAT